MLFVKPVRRAIARDSKFGQGARRAGAFIMQVVDIGLSEIDAFSVQYARVFKPPGFRLMLDHSSNWPCEKEMDR